MVMNQDKMDEIEHSSSPSLDQHIDTQSVYQSLPPNPQAVHISNRIDLVQSSKLQVRRCVGKWKFVYLYFVFVF